MPAQFSLDWMIKKQRHVVPIPGASLKFSLNNFDVGKGELADDVFQKLNAATGKLEIYCRFDYL